MAMRAIATAARQVVGRNGYGCGFAVEPRLSHSSLLRRFLSSSSPSDPPRIAMVHSAEQLKSAFRSLEDESSSAVFYFTATWCGPCRFIAPIFEQMTKEYGDVAFYKIDIDQEELGDQLSELKIASVPTFHFFQDGKFKQAMVGADSNGLKKILQELYK